jgi:hypothetical protein
VQDLDPVRNVRSMGSKVEVDIICDSNINLKVIWGMLPAGGRVHRYTVRLSPLSKTRRGSSSSE